MKHGIAIALSILLSACNSQDAARTATSAGAARLETLASSRVIAGKYKPNPADPQCSACTAYEMSSQKLYVSLPEVKTMTVVELALYFPNGSLFDFDVKTYTDLQLTSSPDTEGTKVYTVKDGPTAGASFGVLTFKDSAGNVNQTRISAVQYLQSSSMRDKR